MACLYSLHTDYKIKHTLYCILTKGFPLPQTVDVFISWGLSIYLIFKPLSGEDFHAFYTMSWECSSEVAFLEFSGVAECFGKNQEENRVSDEMSIY